MDKSEAETLLEEAEADLTRTLTLRGIDPTALKPRKDGTIEAGATIRLPSTADPDVAALPPLLGGESKPQIELRDLQIGEGGMGQVNLAIQVPLDREVAVKVIRQDKASRRITDALLREAQVLGALEHPNIVPVYMLGRDDGDRPMIVMKRVVGTAWSDFVGGTEQTAEGVEGPKAPEDVRDPLEWNLSILMQVCNALHYAHSKGVVHRDVKPSNIMIGEFGEVYLMDWGIAVSIGDQAKLGLPPAAEIHHVAGTPAFMAPEMAAADGSKIDARTDVYLLGACLHLLLTGKHRHDGVTLMNVMTSAFLSQEYKYGKKVPTELAAICNKAMARDPADRYQSAEQMRQALLDAVRHGASMRLAREAHEKLRGLQRITASLSPEDGTARRTYDLFTECRFAFREAIRQWGENAEAKEGLQRTLEVMANYEMDQGSYRAAAALIAELPEPNPKLVARLRSLRQLRKTEEMKIEEWKQIEHDANVELGTRERSYMLLFIGLIYSSFYFVLGFLRRYDIFVADFGTMWIIIVSYTVMVAGFQVLFRKVLRENQVNRRFAAVLWLTALSGTVYWPPAWYGDVLFAHALATLLIMYSIAGLGLVVLIEMRMGPASLALAGGAIGCLLFPDWCFESMGASILVFGVLVWAHGVKLGLPGLGGNKARKAPAG